MAWQPGCPFWLVRDFQPMLPQKSTHSPSWFPVWTGAMQGSFLALLRVVRSCPSTTYDAQIEMQTRNGRSTVEVLIVMAVESERGAVLVPKPANAANAAGSRGESSPLRLRYCFLFMFCLLFLSFSAALFRNEAGSKIHLSIDACICESYLCKCHQQQTETPKNLAAPWLSSVHAVILRT